jgi:excisionase family DNA binding protein
LLRYNNAKIKGGGGMMNLEKAFRNSHLFTKEDLIESFELTKEHIEFDEENHYTQASIQKKLQLCNKFLTELQKCKLPKLAELWWFYDYEFTGDGIALKLCSTEMDDIELEDDGKTISTMSFTEESILLKVECDYLTVDQFAEIQGVSPITVRQWIRRGKLRNAKKMGRDWLIPSLEDKPSRGYESVQYIFSEPIEIHEFPLVAVSDSIFIYQDSDNRQIFHCIFDNFSKNFHQSIELSRKEVEMLELALISSGKVKVDSRVKYVPMIERMRE